MGALTSKSFPFETRGWDIEKFESIDMTDGFGSNTKVYVSKNQIVLIEPDYNTNTLNIWLTDKGRQFFDGIFSSKKTINKKIKSDFWSNLFKVINETSYVLDLCNQLNHKKKFIIIMFENLSLELLNILVLMAQNYSFIKLKRAENFSVNNDLEYNFQLNAASDKFKLDSSTLCLLVSTNPRHEGFYLNLNLRHRFLKGNFECLALGSFLDATFPIKFIGSNIKVLKSLTEGNNLVCQIFKTVKNPTIIYNSELFKRPDGNTVLNVLKIFNYVTKINTAWSGFNMLSPSLQENGNSTLNKFKSISLKDLNGCSFLYLVNISFNSLSNLKILIELNLLNYSNQFKSKLVKNLIVDQNYKNNNSYNLVKKINLNNNFNFYNHIPSSTFYENEETFLSTEGSFKRTSKLIPGKKNKGNWQILRKIFGTLKKNLTSLNRKNDQIIKLNPKNSTNLKNFNQFNYYTTRSVTNLNFYLIVKTSPVVFYNKYPVFKSTILKFHPTKIRYWLDDFFTSGKDEYSQNSLMLANCSKMFKVESANFH